MIVLFSGGVDSTCLLTELAHGCPDVLALSFDYGQRHQREIEAASAITRHLRVEHRILNIGSMFEHIQSPLLRGSDRPIPDGHYGDFPEGAVPTYVPMRNLLLLTAAAAIAICRGSRYIYYAAHLSDAQRGAYPDCTSAFAEAADRAICLGSGDKICGVLAPYLPLTKREVVARGVAHGAPLSLTWSCYRGGDKHCGTCPTCHERREAFEANGLAWEE